MNNFGGILTNYGLFLDVGILKTLDLYNESLYVKLIMIAILNIT